MEENINVVSPRGDKKRTISFSQLSLYNQCQYKWYLSYPQNLRSKNKIR